jgi:hypothetical protein
MPPTRPCAHCCGEKLFSRIQRDVMSRGIFASVKDLNKKLMRYIMAHNNDPRSIK